MGDQIQLAISRCLSVEWRERILGDEVQRIDLGLLRSPPFTAKRLRRLVLQFLYLPLIVVWCWSAVVIIMPRLYFCIFVFGQTFHGIRYTPLGPELISEREYRIYGLKEGLW